MDPNMRYDEASESEQDEKLIPGAIVLLAADTHEDEEENLILKFRRPYSFEGQSYKEIDLSGLEDATGADLIAVERLVKKKGTVDPLIEMSPELACHMAARVTSQPVEFFEQLPLQESIKLKTLVTGFLYGGDGKD